jgi:hypothetical protein
MRDRTATVQRTWFFPWAVAPFIVLGAFILLFPGSGLSLAQGGPPNGLPEQASAQAEAQFEGELEVLYECDEHTARLKHFLGLGNGKRLRLEFEGGMAPDLPTGSRIRAKGRLRHEESNEETLTLPDAGSVEAISVAAGTATFGQRNVIVMLVNFQDNQSQPYSVAAAQALTFDQVNQFFGESSYGQTSLTGDVYGWFTLAMSSTTCDTAQIASLADQAAVSAGVNLSAYSHKLYAFPQISACSWWGLGTVGGSPSRAYVNGSLAVRVVAHELSHNLGLYHSRSQPCASGYCSTVEYGDDHDVMGKSGLVAHTNAFQKERLGWLNYGVSPPIQTVGQSGSYWIDAYAPSGPAAKALKVLKYTDSSGGRTWYYFEARTKYGFDGSVAPGVVVHTGSDSVANSSYQIDLDPVSSSFDSLLDPGQTFSDEAIGFSVKTLWADATGAMVDITYPGVPCSASAPTLTFSPSSTLWTQPGKSAGVTMTVKNNDASGCSAAVFDLASAVPSGWLAAFDRATLTLAPGASAAASLSVTPPTSAVGQYGFTAGASRSAGPTASVSGTVVVSTGLDVVLSVGGSTKSGYPLSATVRNGGQAVSGAAVTFTLTGPSGGVTTLSATSDASGAAAVKWRPKKTDPAGTYQVRVNASAGGLTGSASGTLIR